MGVVINTIPGTHVDNWAFAAWHPDGSASSVTARGFDSDLGNNVSKLGVRSESVLRRVLPVGLAETGGEFHLGWLLMSSIFLLTLGGGIIGFRSLRRHGHIC